jgi:hypothetical protein
VNRPPRRWLRRCALLLAAAVMGGCVAERPADPVVLTGAQVPSLQGAAPGKVLAFRYLGGSWNQVPVQVDERAVMDLAKPLNATPVGHTFLTYTDAGTFTGADPDPSVDSNDEIAFMGIDTGTKAPAGSEPAGVVSGSGLEVRVRDAAGDPTDSYVYLFRQSGSLDPGAGKRYVTYSFNLLSGDYKSTYRLNDGPNPENSTVSSAYYSQHFSDRWINDALRITAPEASGVDVLDRHKNLILPGDCGRSEDTFSLGPGAAVANKSGPVRAIRSVMGANSGRFTQRQHVFYGRRTDVTTFLRVHPMQSLLDLFDYSPAASGMTYRNDVHSGGVTVDGVPDTVATGPIGWESVDGPQGSLGIVHSFDTNISGFTHSSFYLDKRDPATTAPEKQCTGDAHAYGTSGFYVRQILPNTDPTMDAPQRLTFTRSLFYDSPGKADAARRKTQVASPLQSTVTPR